MDHLDDAEEHYQEVGLRPQRSSPIIMPTHSPEENLADGEDDSASTPEQLETLQHTSDKKNRSHHSGRPQGAPASPHDNDGVLKSSFGSATGSGAVLHPLHKKRRNKEHRRSSTEAGYQRRHRSRSKGRHEGRERKDQRRKPSHYEDEEFYTEDDSVRSTSVRSSSGHYHHRGSSSRSKWRSRRLGSIPIVVAVVKFFDGVNPKTVLLCIMGMTLVMKLDVSLSNANHGIKNTPAMENLATVTPGVRGAMMNENEEAAGVVNQATLQQFDPQAQLVAAADPNTSSAYTNIGAAQSKNYAVGQQSTYDQSPPLQQQAQFGSAVDASQMLPPQTAEVVGADVAQVAAVDVAQQPTVQAVEVPLVPHLTHPAVQGSVLTELINFKDTWDPYDKTDIPMFWHIPKAGGSSIKDAMGGCHRFVQATEFGITDGHDADTTVAIVYPSVPGVADTDRSPFVNIDSTTVAGIQRAKSMGFADAQLAGVVVSPFVFETNDLFTQTAKGRFFSVFRHPIDRAVSMFYYIRVADWEPSYKPELQEWTLEQYATSDIVENNWMTRQLSNQLGGELTDENLKKAMEVVRSKFLVGLMTQIGPSMTRFEKFFRWTYHVNPPNQEACRERLMSGGSNSNAANKKPVAEGDPAWDLLAHQNNFDLQLYTYIESLFVEQEAFVAGMPDDFRKVDGTCCKCGPPTFPPEGFTCPEAVKNA